MLSLEQATFNVIYTKGLFSFPLEAFQFNWDILDRVFTSTFDKYEKFFPKIKTIQTGGGNPIIMPEDCIYPRAIGFGNNSMIAPQTATVDSQSWTYDRDTRSLSVFTHTAASAPFKVQYLAKYPKVQTTTTMSPFKVYDNEELVDIQLETVPDVSTLVVSKGQEALQIVSRDRHTIQLEGDWGTADLNLTSLVLSLNQTETSEGYINVKYTNKYKAYDSIIDDQDFLETWYAANILTSMGNIKAVLKLDQMPNDINADGLLSQGQELMRSVIDWQKEKQAWWRGYLGARI